MVRKIKGAGNKSGGSQQDIIKQAQVMQQEMLKIQEGLNKLIKNKTVVIISHRLKSIQNVNQIILLDEGKVVSNGTHDEIYNESQLYRNMIEKSDLTEMYSY